MFVKMVHVLDYDTYCISLTTVKRQFQRQLKSNPPHSKKHTIPLEQSSTPNNEERSSSTLDWSLCPGESDLIPKTGYIYRIMFQNGGSFTAIRQVNSINLIFVCKEGKEWVWGEASSYPASRCVMWHFHDESGYPVKLTEQ